jgi:hypothetical protein
MDIFSAVSETALITLKARVVFCFCILGVIWLALMVSNQEDD